MSEFFKHNHQKLVWSSLPSYSDHRQKLDVPNSGSNSGWIQRHRATTFGPFQTVKFGQLSIFSSTQRKLHPSCQKQLQTVSGGGASPITVQKKAFFTNLETGSYFMFKIFPVFPLMASSCSAWTPTGLLSWSTEASLVAEENANWC